MPGISIGSVSVSVVPDMRGFTDKLRSALLPQADALGAEIGRRIADGINASLHGITITANVNVDTAAARAALDELGSQRVAPAVTLDDSRIVTALEDITVKLEELDRSVTDVRLALEDGGIGMRLDEIGLKLDEIGSRDAAPRLTLDDSGFNRQLDEDMAKLAAAGNASASPGFGGGGGLLGAGLLGAVAVAPALPGPLAGAGAAVASLGLAVQGIGPALSAYTAAQTAAATATGKTGAAATSAASQIHSAEQAVSVAETQAAHDAVTSAESIKNAHTAVAQAVAQAAQSQTSAEQTLANAQYAEKAAQQALTDARQQAILTLQQLNNSAADASLAAEQAQLNLTQALMTQRQVNASVTSTALQRAQADLSVREAEQRLKEAQQQRTNSARDAAKADKEGVNGLPAVVAAQHNLAQAHQATGNAQRALVLAEQQGAASITRAQQSLADAVRNASWKQQGDALSVSNAQYRLHAAYASAAAGGTSAAAAAAKYAYALSQLSPGGQQMVKDILGLNAGFDSLKSVAQGAIAPGFTTFLQGVHALLPTISAEVKTMSGIIGGALSATGKAFASSGFQATLKSLFAEGDQFIQVVGPALGQMVRAFLDMGAKSAPAVRGLADGLAAIARGIGDLFRNLAPAAPAIGSVLRSLGEAVGAIGGPLGSVLGDLMRVLAPVLQAALPLLKTLLDQIAGAVTPLVNELLPPLRDVLAAIGPPLTGLARDTGQLAAGLIRAAAPLFQVVGALAKDLAPVLPGIVALLSSLANDALSVLAQVVKAVAPPLEILVNSVFKALQPVLPQVEASLAQIGAILAGVLGQAVKALAPVLAQTAQQFGQILAALIPLLPPLLKLATLLIDLAALAVTPLLPLIGDMLTALGSVSGAINVLIGWIARIISATLNWVANIGHWKQAFGDAWNWVVSNVFNPMKTLFLTAIPGWWHTVIANLNTMFVTPFKNAISGAWNWVTSNVFSPMNHFLTSTLPGWFGSAVNGIKSVWDKLKGVVTDPVKFVVDVIYDKGIVPVINAVGGLIGLHVSSVHIPGLAEGGKVTAGTGPKADDVLARVSRGETVVSAEHSQALAPIFSAVGVPGYAAGGIPNPIGWVEHEASSVWKSIVGGLKNLTGDALAAAVKHFLDPLVNAMPGGGTVLGADLKKIPVTMAGDLVAALKGTGVAAAVGSGSGADVAKYAASYGTGHGHPYAWGGSSPSGWDCSGFSAWVYEHFGYFPEKQGTRHGTSQSQFSDPLLQSSGAVPGALAFFNGSDGPVGHVGITLNPNAYVSAYDTAEGTVVKPTKGALGFRIPKGGFVPFIGTGIGGSVSAGAAQVYARSRLGHYGWGAGEMPPLIQLWQHESGWNRLARNPGSGAYGIPQALPGSKMGAAANPPTSSATAQIDWGLPYIKSVYGTPAAAWAKWQARSPHWYDDGGWMPPGLSLSLNGTGRPEPVLSGAQWDLISTAVAGGDGTGLGGRHVARKLDRMIDLLERAPARTAGGLGEALNGTARGAVHRGYFRTR